MSGLIVGIFGAAALAVLIYLMVRGGNQAEKPKTVIPRLDATGLRDLLDEGREDEAVETYRKFAGVDEYTARATVERLKQGEWHG